MKNMRYALLIIVFIITISITGCVSVCDQNHPKLCDKNCKINSDCKQACPVGCINKNQNYQNPTDIDCAQMACRCENDICRP